MINENFEKNIKVSVVMAIYNCEKYLKESLDSLINQTLSDIEIICVNDGSTDSTSAILNEYAKIDNRIIIINNNECSDGAAYARNIGIKEARGDYLIVLDGDDYFEKDMLEKAYCRITDTKAQILIFDGYTYDNENRIDVESTNILRKKYLPKGLDVFSPEEVRENLFQISIGAAWNILFSLKFIRDNKIRFASFHFADDIGFVFTSFASARKIAVLRERLIHYRINNNKSQANNITKWPEVCYLAFLDLKNELDSRGKFEYYKVSYVKRSLEYISFFLLNLKTSESFIKLYNALKHKYASKLELTSISEGQISVKWHSILLNLLETTSPEDFLMKKAFSFPPFEKKYSFSREVPKNKKIVIYGAGEYGKIVFNDLFSNDYKIISWVDKSYKNKGFPIQDPEVITKLTECDFVCVVTIIDPVVRDSVIEFLANKGIKSGRIITLTSIISNY